MDFPDELAKPDLIGALVQHADDDEIIGLRIDACLNHGDPTSWSNFLRSSGLVERETLNHVARSGACQFSAVADQLFRSRPVTESFRPDVYLRLLALHCVSWNQNAFQDFMLHAAPVTRQQRQRGGGGVDMEEYARRMASSRCDGDHITLQALCDALKVNINVVKWTRNDGWYLRPTITDSTGTPAANASTRRRARQASSSLPSVAGIPDAEPANAEAPTVKDETRRPRRSVFVADTLRPRAVASLDPRARGLQLQGRTLWLSLHGEAHFRSLRVRDPMTEEELALARTRAGSVLPAQLSPPTTSGLVAAGSLSPRAAATEGAGSRGASSGESAACGEQRRASSPVALSTVCDNRLLGNRSDNGSEGRSEDRFEGRSESRSGNISDGGGAAAGAGAAAAANSSANGALAAGAEIGLSETPDVTRVSAGGGLGSAPLPAGSSVSSGTSIGDSLRVPMATRPVAALPGASDPGEGEKSSAGAAGKAAGREECGAVVTGNPPEGQQKAGEEDEEEEEEVVDCSICMCAVTGEPDAASLDKCTHAFHFACIIKWGETTNQCPMCKARFYVVTRLGDQHVKRFRGSRRRRGGDGGDVNVADALLAPAIAASLAEEEEADGARAVCLHCADGGSEEQLMLCDGAGCENGAHTFCCGLDAVPSGDWFCPSCQALRDANDRRDAILRRAWAVGSGSEADEPSAVRTGGDDENVSSRSERRRRSSRLTVPVPELDSEAGELASAPAVGGWGRRRRGVAAGVAAAAGGGAGAAIRASSRGRVMDDERVEAFERGLANSSGESNNNGDDDENEDEDEEVEGGEEEEEEEEKDEADSYGGSSSSPMGLESSRSSQDDEDDDGGFSGAESGSAIRNSEQRSGAGPQQGRRARARSRATGNAGGNVAARPRGTPSPRSCPTARGNNHSRTRGSDSQSSSVDAVRRVGGAAAQARSTNTTSASVDRPSVRDAIGNGGEGGAGMGSGVIGPNLWPRVLASASSAMAPRHVFADEEDEKEEEEGGAEEDGEQTAGAAGVVAQSWADAKLAEQLSRGGKNKKKKKKGNAPSPSEVRLEALRAPSIRQPLGRGGGSSGALRPAASSSSSSSAATTATATGTTATLSSTLASTPPRRAFKRPRMMRPSSAALTSPPPPPPPLSSSSTSSSMRNANRMGSEGRRLGGNGGGRTNSPWLPAASDVRLGQSDVQALVLRLRGVAIAERERRSSRGSALGSAAAATWRFDLDRGSQAVGAAGAGNAAADGGQRDDPSVSVEVETAMEELRRVAVDGDATTLDMLLSSQLPSVLRLWLEPAADGRAFLPSPQRSSLLKVLMALPVQKSHLRESGIGKLVVAMAADPGETRENRELIKQIIRRWSQLVFRTPRRLPVSPFSPHNHASPIPRRPIDMTDVNSPSGGPSTATSAAAAGRGKAWAAAVRSHRARSHERERASPPPLHATPPLQPTSRAGYGGAVGRPPSDSSRGRPAAIAAAGSGSAGSGSGGDGGRDRPVVLYGAVRRAAQQGGSGPIPRRRPVNRPRSDESAGAGSGAGGAVRGHRIPRLPRDVSGGGGGGASGAAARQGGSVATGNRASRSPGRHFPGGSVAPSSPASARGALPSGLNNTYSSSFSVEAPEDPSRRHLQHQQQQQRALSSPPGRFHSRSPVATNVGSKRQREHASGFSVPRVGHDQVALSSSRAADTVGDSHPSSSPRFGGGGIRRDLGGGGGSSARGEGLRGDVEEGGVSSDIAAAAASSRRFHWPAARRSGGDSGGEGR